MNNETDLKVDEALWADVRAQPASRSRITTWSEARSYVWAQHERDQMDPLSESEASLMYPQFDEAFSAMISTFGLELDRVASEQLWPLLMVRS